MDVDPYRLAYNVLHCNLKKFGIQPEDIPPPKTEKVDSLDTIIPGFSIAVALFQIASRKDLKTFLDTQCPTVHNLSDVYTRFINIMRETLPKGTIVLDSPIDEVNEGLSEDATNEGLSEDATNEGLSENAANESLSEDAANEGLSENATNEDVSQDTMEEYLSEDSMGSDLPEDIKKEILPDDAMKEDPYNDDIKEGLPGDSLKENLCEDAMKQGLSENTVRSEDIPGLIAYSLAVCTELVLYERENENNKAYIKYMPELWKKYFDNNLKALCKEARCTQDHLKAYSNSIKCPEKFLNNFISENKNEYNDIADKFYHYTETNYAVDSPDSSKSITEVRNFPKGLSFMKMREKYTVIKDICKCMNGPAADEMPLLEDYSPCSTSSTSTNPSN